MKCSASASASAWGGGVGLGGAATPSAPLSVAVVSLPLSPSFSSPALRRPIRRPAAERGSRRWWSDSDDGYNQDEDDGVQEDDAFPGFGSDLFDEPWFSKVFRTYGYLLPVMLASMLVATGPRAFLMAMAIPLGQSAISFLIDAIWGRNERSRKQPPFEDEEDEEDYPEYSTSFAAGGQGSGDSSSSNYYGRRKQHSYQSWVSDDFASAASFADDDYSAKSSGGRGGNGGGFGGWDEVLPDDDKRSPDAGGYGAHYSKGSPSSLRPWQTSGGEKDAGADAGRRGGEVGVGMGAPPARRRARGGRMSSSKYKQAPLLMRLLVAVFPFLGSWFRLL